MESQNQTLALIQQGREGLKGRFGKELMIIPSQKGLPKSQYPKTLHSVVFRG